MNYEVLGNALPHLHTHLVPRYLDDPAPGRPFPFLGVERPNLPEGLSSAMLRRCERCSPTLTHNLTSSLASPLASRHTPVVILGL